MAIDTSSLSALNSIADYGSSSASGTATPYTGSTSIAPSGTSVAASNDTAAVDQAVQLAGDASAIVSLGNSIGSDGLTYNAAGVFDAIVDAGTAQNTSTSLTQDQATTSLYQGILSGLTSSPGAAGIYNGAGEFTGLDTGFTSQLASLLKSNPDLTGTIVGDVATQGIVGSLLSTTA